MRNACAIIKHDSEHKLRPRIALLGQWPRQPHRGRVIASLTCNDSILERPRNGCRANHSKYSHEHAEERPSLQHDTMLTGCARRFTTFFAPVAATVDRAGSQAAQ